MFNGIHKLWQRVRKIGPKATIPRILDASCLLPLQQPRKIDTDKRDYGHVLIIGGDFGMPGAVRLAAEAAYRVGAGLVSVVTRSGHVAAIVADRPEIMVHGIDAPEDLTPLLARATVIVLGPGLGQSAWSFALFNAALATNLPLLVDADALNLLAVHAHTRANWVLTPHASEAARLLESTPKAVQANRVQAMQALQTRYLGTVVLKGPGTLIVGPQGQVSRCPAGNPGMATGGMGDTLSGIIGGLMAQGHSPYDSACMGVYAHSRAADILAAQDGQHGLLALDIIPVVRKLINGKS
jgi:NAD(P)H-hydrate epimerase